MSHYGKLAYTYADAPPGTTDGLLVTGSPNRIIVVYAMACIAGSTATNISFNSAPGGVNGVTKTMSFRNAANGGFILPYSEAGWFQTNSGDYLTYTTGAGATTGIQVVYAFETVPGATS